MGKTAQTKPKKARQLTVKQKKFVKAYVAADGNGEQAALKVYDAKDENVARAIASQNLTKLNVREAIEKALEKHEITIDAAIKPIADGLEATREGSEQDPDHHIRLKASGMALKLLGAEQSDATGNTFNFINVAKQENDEFGI